MEQLQLKSARRFFRANQWVFGSLLIVGLAGCSGDDSSTGPARDRLRVLAVSGVAGNVLTARVLLEASGFDSVRITYQSAGESPRSTPAKGVRGDSLLVRVAGLASDRLYQLQAEGWRRGVIVMGDTSSFQTQPLPSELQDLSFSIVSGTPGPGYFLVPQQTGPTGYAVIYDSTGMIRWYLSTAAISPGVAPTDLKQLPNGNILAYLGSTRGWDPVVGRFYEFDLDGSLIRSYGAPVPLYTDNHDIEVEFEDSVPVASTLFGYEIRTLDLTPYGGAASVSVAGHQIIRQLANGEPRFFWNAWDRFSLLDWIEEPQTLKQGPSADFDHPNALTRDLDGNYLVSWRSMGEITKINALTGAIIWRWGGRNNQFTFVNDPLNLFSGQHSVKVLSNGHFLLYDNGLRHAPPETRMAEYVLDTSAHTATLVWEYRHTPPIFTGTVGWVERLASGNTFIGWGAVGRVQEVTPDKSTVWEARTLYQGATATFYRIRWLPDLYTYQTP